MNILVVYVCVSKGRHSKHLAERFIASYHKFRAGFNHNLLVVLNGFSPPESLRAVFTNTPHWCLNRYNTGWDIGAYQEVAQCIKSDLMVCLGESVYFHRTDWLLRLMEACEIYGKGMYGFLSSYQLAPHLNTTAFACSPELIRSYPINVLSKGDRYQFEHGAHSLWRRVENDGRPAVFVTWDGVWPRKTWRYPQNILCRGDQTNLLAWCNHTDNYASAPPHMKDRLAKLADGELKVQLAKP